MIVISRRAKWYNIKHFVGEIGTLCSICATFSLVCFFILVIAAFTLRTTKYIQIVYVDKTGLAPFETSKKFLSIGLDDIVLAEGFKNFNMTDKKLIYMMKAISPAYLRIGGNLADKLLFSPGEDLDKSVQAFYRDSTYLEGHFDYINSPNYTLTGFQWLQLINLAEAAKLTVIFDLNSLIRFSNGSWDYRNAETLINFSQSHNLKVNWELGNEPNSYPHKFNESVSAIQLSKDFITLRNILNKYPLYKNSLLVGPDSDRPQTKQGQTYLKNFLENSKNTVDAVTFHQYYFNGRTATVAEFLDPTVFDVLKFEIYSIRSIFERFYSGKRLWLGETSSAFGGGAPNKSDTFLASFIWLDKLGVSAKMGIDVVIRQSIFRGFYALLDNSYNPNPDMWLSLIYKSVVGPKVVPCYEVSTPKLRMYCHCTNNKIFGTTNSITIFGLNLDANPANVRIEGLFSLDSNKLQTVYALELTTINSLLTKSVLLNGKPLKMTANGSFPNFVPKKVSSWPYLTMPPFSIVFWIIPRADVLACLS